MDLFIQLESRGCLHELCEFRMCNALEVGIEGGKGHGQKVAEGGRQWAVRKERLVGYVCGLGGTVIENGKDESRYTYGS